MTGIGRRRRVGLGHAHALLRRPAARPTSGREVAVCGWVARRREHGEHLAFLDVRDHTGIIQCVVDGAPRHPQRVRRARDGHGARPPGGHGEPGARDRRGRARRLHGRDPGDVPSRRRSPLDERAETDEPSGCATATSTCGPTAMQANLRLRAVVNSAIAPVDGPPGLRRDRDAAAVGADAGGRARVRRAVAAAARPVLRRCPRAPRSPSSCSMVGGFDRYYQIAALPARRGPARRPPVRVHPARRGGELRRPGRRPRLRLGGRARGGRGGDRRAPRGVRPDDLGRGPRPLRHRQARPALRHGARRPHRRSSPAPRFKAFARPGREGDRRAGRSRPQPRRASTS